MQTENETTEAKAGHTPGPWRYEEKHGDQLFGHVVSDYYANESPLNPVASICWRNARANYGG
jgi:hypothetical protein